MVLLAMNVIEDNREVFQFFDLDGDGHHDGGHDGKHDGCPDGKHDGKHDGKY